MSARALNLWVFRDGRRQTSGSQLKAALVDELRSLPAHPASDLLIPVLLRAGELECGIADEGNVPLQPWQALTDQLAQALASPDSPLDIADTSRIVESGSVPKKLETATPEGFAYYALHPLDYADALYRLPDTGDSVAVIGIRSIGTTLSAMTAAAARCRGKHAERITVRPAGHPYNRCITLSASELSFVYRNINDGSAFLVVDEGPGLSGSSFLSVAEALEKAGVAPEKILLLCAHPPNIDHFCSENGPQRARRFAWLAVSRKPRKPQDADEFIGSGRWRDILANHREHWPASWTSFERVKYLSAPSTERKLFKFLGLGHYGRDVLFRERSVSEAGFSVRPERKADGFVSYSWIEGVPMSASDLSQANIERLADYCAFRAQAFSSNSADMETLQQMSEHNLTQLNRIPEVQLRLECPVVPDGRLQPHEWLLTPAGKMLKTDSGAHGNDHFFPGPTDIAWDLAGAIVEWEMTSAQAQCFLERYRSLTGDDAQNRLSGFVTAYAAFRCAYSLMAANALAGSSEQERLEREARVYKGRLSHSTRHALACS